jgi:two-component system chemotaxis response regulator CheY
VVIDDDQDDLDLLKRVFKKHFPDIHTIYFSDPVDALQAITQELIVAPDYIITDINMPKMTGDVLVAELRQRPELDQTIICVLSTHMPEEKAASVKQAGAHHAFQKPAQYQHYFDILKELFSRS